MPEELEKLKGRFWTRADEMKADIEEETDFDVLSIGDLEMNIIDRNSEDDRIISVSIIRAGRTISLG